MSTHSPKPILSSEEVQRIIDERLEVILGKETAESYDTAVSGPSRKERGRSFFRWLAGLFKNN